MKTLRLEPGELHENPACECCGARSLTTYGFVYQDDDAHAVYYAGWSAGHPGRGVSLAIGVGEWGDGSTPADRVSVGVLALPTPSSVSFTVLRPSESPWSETPLLGKMLEREQALAHQMLTEVMRVAEQVVRCDPHVSQFLNAIDMSEHKKLRFEYETDNGTTEVETLWAIEREGGYEIDNIPFYVQRIALGDLVAAEPTEGRQFNFTHVIKPGGHTTVRVLFAREEDVSSFCAELVRLGCSWEGSDLRRLVAVDVPPEVNYAEVKAFLDDGERDARFEYEEACLGQEPTTPGTEK